METVACVLSLHLQESLDDYFFLLQKLLFDIFYVTALSLPNITLLLFTAFPTAQQVNQTFIVAIKTMVYFRSFLVVKLLSSSLVFMLLQI